MYKQHAWVMLLKPHVVGEARVEVVPEVTHTPWGSTLRHKGGEEHAVQNLHHKLIVYQTSAPKERCLMIGDGNTDI